MRLCASYFCKNDCLDEIRYPVTMLNTVFTEIVEHPGKTYIVEVLDVKNQNFPVEKLLSLMQEQKNLVVDCYQRADFLAMHQVHMPRIMYHYPVNTYNDLWWLLQFNPYAITISEPLTFDLPTVRKCIDAQTKPNEYIQVRVMPALGRPSSWTMFALTDTGMRHFWITPQTIHIYEPYIDVLDLYDADQQREAQLVKLYNAGECQWDMSVLLKNCGCALPASMVDDEWVERRLTCGQRCMQLNRNCHYCDTRARLALEVIGPNYHRETT